jgi:hypothetical protein
MTKLRLGCDTMGERIGRIHTDFFFNQCFEFEQK